MNFNNYTSNLIQKSWPLKYIIKFVFFLIIILFIESIVIYFIPKNYYEILIFVTYLLCLLFLLFFKKKYELPGFGLNLLYVKKLKIVPISYIIIILIFIPIIPVNEWLVVNIFKTEIKLQDALLEIKNIDSTLRLTFYLLSVIIIVPIFEELIFRGILFPKLVKRTGLISGLTICSVIFAILHFHLPSLLPLFILSIVLCLLYWFTETMWTCIGLHILFNGITVLAFMYS